MVSVNKCSLTPVLLAWFVCGETSKAEWWQVIVIVDLWFQSSCNWQENYSLVDCWVSSLMLLFVTSSVPFFISLICILSLFILINCYFIIFCIIFTVIFKTLPYSISCLTPHENILYVLDFTLTSTFDHKPQVVCSFFTNLLCSEKKNKKQKQLLHAVIVNWFRNDPFCCWTLVQLWWTGLYIYGCIQMSGFQHSESQLAAY